MKKMKKILGLGKKRKEQQQSQDWDKTIIPSLDCVSSGFKMQRRNQGKLHKALTKGDLKEQDIAGRTPLLIATSNQKHDLTNVLLSYGSDVFHKDVSGRSAWDYATQDDDDPILHQYVTGYSKQKKEAEGYLDDQSVLSVVSSPLRVGDIEFALGASATNKEGREVHQLLNQAGGDSGKETLTDYHSSRHSLSDSGEMGNDTWLSSGEEDLDLSSKKQQKPDLAQLRNITQLFKKYYNDNENNQSSEENMTEGFQKNLNPTKQKIYDANDSSMNYEEAEFGEEEEGHDKKEEKEKEEEKGFNEERKDENMKESQRKIENGEEENFEKVGKRETFTDSEHEGKRDLSSSDREVCNAQDEEMQEAGNLHVSFSARHYECSTENAAINKANYELSSDPFEKKNSSKHDHGLNSQANKDVTSDWSDFSENYYNRQSDTECEAHKIIDQNSENSENPDLMDYQNTSDKQHTSTKELVEAVLVQLQRNENNKEDVPKTFQPTFSEDSSEEEDKEEEQEDDKEEDQKNPDVLDQNLIYCGSSQISLQEEIVRKTILAGVDEEEEKKDSEPLQTLEFEEEIGEEELKIKTEATNTGKLLTTNTEEKIEPKIPIEHIQTDEEIEGVLAGENQVTNILSLSDREECIPVPSRGMTDIRKSQNKHQISTQRVSQQVTGKLDWLQDDFSLDEGEGNILTSIVEDLRKSQNKRWLLMERVSHQIKEKLHQLQNDSSLSEASSEEENVMDATKNENKSQISTKRISQQITEKLHQIQDDSSLSEVSLEEVRFSLKQEEEKRICFEQLYEKTQEQLRKRDQQYCTLMVEKQQLEFMLRNMEIELKTLKNNLKQLQGLEEQYLQSERHIHNVRNALDAKKREANVTSQRLQSLLAAASEANNTIKCLEEHIKRLEIENKSLEATTNQQSNKIEMLHKNLQDNVSVHNQLEKEINGLQNEKIKLEEQVNELIQKQNAVSVTAQDTHSICEELKSRPKLHFSELDKEKGELRGQFEKERKKVKKLVELKRSISMQLAQEKKRNSELEKKCNGFKILLKTTKKKLKESESGESSSQTRFHNDVKNQYSDIYTETGKLQKEKSFIYSLHLGKETPKQDNATDFNQMQQYKKAIEEQAKQEVRQKLEEVNLFLQTQAASQETLEQIRATNNASLINQLENIIRDLESELSNLKSRLQDCVLQNESAFIELKRYKALYLEESKRRKCLASKLALANDKLTETKAKLFHERCKNKSLLANSFISGSLSTSPILETVQLGNLGSNLAFNSPPTPGGGFRNPTESPLASKSRVEAYMAKMQTELEKNIKKELDQAELHIRSGRVSPKGSFDGPVKKLNMDEDQVAKATQEYLDVLNKNYML